MNDQRDSQCVGQMSEENWSIAHAIAHVGQCKKFESPPRYFLCFLFFSFFLSFLRFLFEVWCSNKVLDGDFAFFFPFFVFFLFLFGQFFFISAFFLLAFFGWLVGWLVGFLLYRVQHGHTVQSDDAAIERK